MQERIKYSICYWQSIYFLKKTGKQKTETKRSAWIKQSAPKTPGWKIVTSAFNNIFAELMVNDIEDFLETFI